MPVPQTGQAWWEGRGERHWGQTTRLGVLMAIWVRLRPWRDLEVFFFGTGIGQLPSSSFVLRAASSRQRLSLWGWQEQGPSFRLAPQSGQTPAQSRRRNGFPGIDKKG